MLIHFRFETLKRDKSDFSRSRGQEMAKQGPKVRFSDFYPELFLPQLCFPVLLDHGTILNGFELIEYQLVPLGKRLG